MSDAARVSPALRPVESVDIMLTCILQRTTCEASKAWCSQHVRSTRTLDRGVRSSVELTLVSGLSSVVKRVSGCVCGAGCPARSAGRPDRPSRGKRARRPPPADRAPRGIARSLGTHRVTRGSVGSGGGCHSRRTSRTRSRGGGRAAAVGVASRVGRGRGDLSEAPTVPDAPYAVLDVAFPRDTALLDKHKAVVRCV